MANAGTATIEVRANTDDFEKQIAKIEETLSGLPSRVLMDYCHVKPWTLVRIGWYIGIGLSWWYAFVCLVAWLLQVIFGENLVSNMVG